MATYTALSIIDQARALVNREGTDAGVTNPQLLPWLNARYASLWRKLTEVAPDLYTAREDFTISSGSTRTISATDFGRVLKLEKLNGSTYVPMAVAPLLTAETVDFGYRMRAGTTLDIFPSNDALGSYRLTYLTKAGAITATGDSLSLPEGADHILALELAAKIRARVDDGGTEMAEARELWMELRDSLVNQYASTPQQIAEVY